MKPRFRLSQYPACALLAIIAGAPVGGCSTKLTDLTAGRATAAMPEPQSSRPADPRQDAEHWGARYRSNPSDPEAAIRYARALRANGQRVQASAVLEQASLAHPRNTDVLGAYGRALADVGNYSQALEVLGRAHTPEQPDWRILSAQGAVLDQVGRHSEAQQYYATALKIAPDEPSVLSNLGLSYALAKDLPRAEETLRRAARHRAADPRVRQNLALVVGLQGRFADAEEIARADLPPEQAAANAVYLREMLSQKSKPKALDRAAMRAANPVN